MLYYKTIAENESYMLQFLEREKVLVISYKNQFNLLAYKEANMKALEMAKSREIVGVIGDHRQTSPMTKEAQKWFTYEFTKLVNQELGEYRKELKLVAIYNNQDMLRRVIVTFVVHVFGLITGMKFYYTHTYKDALKIFELEEELAS